MLEKEVTFLSEQVENKYSNGLSAAKTSHALLCLLEEWKWCADDALQVAKTMSELDFFNFQNGLAKERRGEFAGEEWVEQFGAILMPAKMMKASILASQHNCCWGTAWKRMRDLTK